jgi:hypothetical protein
MIGSLARRAEEFEAQTTERKLILVGEEIVGSMAAP